MTEEEIIDNQPLTSPGQRDARVRLHTDSDWEFYVVVNDEFGGFSVNEGFEYDFRTIKESDGPISNRDWDEYMSDIVSGSFRHDPDLINLLRKYQDEDKDPAGRFASLVIETIHSPFYIITEYDGLESVETPINHQWSVIQTNEVVEKYPELFV